MADSEEVDEVIVVEGTSNGGGGVDVIQIPTYMYQFTPLDGPYVIAPPDSPWTPRGGDDTPDVDPKKQAADGADAANLVAGAAAVGSLFVGPELMIGEYSVATLLSYVSAESWLGNGILGHIVHDPPQPNFRDPVVVQARVFRRIAATQTGPLFDVLAALVRVEAIGRAFIDAVERYQGALIAGHPRAAFVQLRAAAEMGMNLGRALEAAGEAMQRAASQLRGSAIDVSMGREGLEQALVGGSAERRHVAELIRAEPGFEGVDVIHAAHKPRIAREELPLKFQLSEILVLAARRFGRISRTFTHPTMCYASLRRRKGLWSGH